MTKAKAKTNSDFTVSKEMLTICVLVVLLAMSVVCPNLPKKNIIESLIEETYTPLAAKQAAKLASKNADFEAVTDRRYWLKLAPGLHISEDKQGMGSPVQLPEEHLQQLQADIVEQGYLHLDARAMDWGVPLQILANAVLRLEEMGWNPTWLLLYDEVWQICHQLSAVLSRTTRSRQIFDFYVFNIPKAQGQGWNIHRDRDGSGDFTDSFHTDGVPKYSTVWVALTQATPLNSCIYSLPASSDPYYFGSNDSNATSGQDPGMAVREAGWQEVRAMPAAQGDVYSWSHRLLHWGSSSTTQAKHNRIALSFAVADEHFESPLLARGQDALPFPTWEERLVLCAFQLIKYHHNLPVSDQVKGILIGIMSRHGKLLARDALHDSAYVANFDILYPLE